MGLIENLGRVASVYMDEKEKLQTVGDKRKRTRMGHGFWPHEALRDAINEVNDPSVEAIVQAGTNLAMARLSLWLDFVFIVVYLAALLQLTRHFTRDRPGIRERMVARWVRALFVIAGISDVAENIVLLNNFNPPSDSLSLTATILALVKFTGLILGMAGLVVIRASRRRPLTHSH